MYNLVNPAETLRLETGTRLTWLEVTEQEAACSLMTFRGVRGGDLLSSNAQQENQLLDYNMLSDHLWWWY